MDCLSYGQVTVHSYIFPFNTPPRKARNIFWKSFILHFLFLSLRVGHEHSALATRQALSGSSPRQCVKIIAFSRDSEIKVAFRKVREAVFVFANISFCVLSSGKLGSWTARSRFYGSSLCQNDRWLLCEKEWKKWKGSGWRLRTVAKYGHGILPRINIYRHK